MMVSLLRSVGYVLHLFTPQDVFFKSYKEVLEKAKNVKIELDPKTMELISMKEKGLNGALKKISKRHIE